MKTHRERTSRSPGAFVASVALVLSTMSGLARATEPLAETKPKSLGLVEKAGAHLGQLDITVTGPPEILDTLTRQDFDVYLGNREVNDFVLDKMCPTATAVQPHEVTASSGTALRKEEARPNPATFLFYFDQPELTFAGRQRSLDVARQLVHKLIVGGNRGMIMSNAREMAIFAPLSSDPEKLLSGLDRLERDPQQWDASPSQEEEKTVEIQRAIGDEAQNPYHKSGKKPVVIPEAEKQPRKLMRSYFAEELWRTERSLARLSTILGQLAELDPPKAVLYFADTVRMKPGEHFFKFFGEYPKQGSPGAGSSAESAVLKDSDPIPGRTFGACAAFGHVVEAAAAHGIRFYTIQAEGLVPSSVRASDTQDTLSSLALETGGEAFLHGLSAQKIAARIEQDLSCVYLLSFDPARFPKDKPLSVHLVVHRPRIKAQVRGTLVLQSESARITSRLLAAFASPEATKSDIPVSVRLIPTGFDHGAFSALLQIVVPGSKLPGAAWDLGASVVSRGSVREDVSARLSVNVPDAPLVLEREVRFAPGPYEIIAVAREVSTDQIASLQFTGEWPDLDAQNVTIAPLVALEPATGAFLRGEATHTTGSIALLPEEPLRADAPTALVGLVCFDRSQNGGLRIERSLIGQATVPFSAIEIEPGADRCVQIRDVIRARSMGPGEFRYEVRVTRGEEEIAKAERRFTVVAPATGGVQ